jgi:predicted N-acetyltransferase YhbS
MSLTIRQETPADYAEVCELVKTSFATNVDDDGTTHDYLNKLRTKDTFVPDLSLVAEDDDGSIVGQIVLYKTFVTTDRGKVAELVLSPICVRPDRFRRGIARAMVEDAVRIAAKMGFDGVFLCGDPAIYGRLGFVPSKQYGIYHVKDKDAEWSMVRELYPGALSRITGTVDTI